MKRILPILFVILALSQQVRATNVSGAITSNTTWTKANSPYIVTGATLVDDGAILYIEPGVEVRVDPNIDFFVDGSLRAIGSASDPILFKSNIANPGRTSWRGITMRNSGAADSTIFNYCHFTSGNRAVFADLGDVVVVDYCQFTECFQPIISRCYGGYYIGNSVIKHCQTGIDAGGGPKGVVINNEIAHIATGIVASGGYIANNFIHDATTQGILLSSSTWSYSEVANNTVVNCDKGFVLHGGSSNGVHHNLSAYNYGGYVVENNFTGNITNNTALHNNTGLYITSAQAVFKNNCIDSSTQYIVKAEGWVSQIDVTGNYWGTTDSTTLYNNSFEFNDNFISPKVLILPALQPGDGNCKQYTGPVVTKIQDTKSSSVAITVSPNPFTDRFAIDLQSKATTLEVFNMAGQKLISLDATNSNKMEVDMSAYPAGVYHYRVAFTDHTTATGKLLKQ